MLVCSCTYTSPTGFKYKMIGYGGTKEEWRRYLGRTYGPENIADVKFSNTKKPSDRMMVHNIDTRREKRNAKKTV